MRKVNKRLRKFQMHYHTRYDFDAHITPPNWNKHRLASAITSGVWTQHREAKFIEPSYRWRHPWVFRNAQLQMQGNWNAAGQSPRSFGGVSNRFSICLTSLTMRPVSWFTGPSRPPGLPLAWTQSFYPTNSSWVQLQLCLGIISERRRH